MSSGHDDELLSNNDSWFADILGDSSDVGEQLKAVKEFAYKSFDKLDHDGNGFISRDELVAAMTNPELKPRERMFLAFLLENHDQISDASDERTIADGISKSDLDAYFDLVATLL